MLATKPKDGMFVVSPSAFFIKREREKREVP
jgi:hypothetical protein